MAVVQKIEAKIGADDKQFRSKLKETEKRTNQFTKSVQKMGAVLVAAFAVNAVKNFLQESVRLADVQQKAEASLLTALRGREDVQQRLIKQAQELQKTTLFGDEETIKAQALLVQLGMTEEQVTQLIPKIQDMASGLQMDLVSAASLVGKSVTSSTNALARYGIEIDATGTASEKTGLLVEALTQKFEGQAETAAKTGMGPVKQLENAFGDIREEIGNRLIPMLASLATMLQSTLPAAFDVFFKAVDQVSSHVDRAFGNINMNISGVNILVEYMTRAIQPAKLMWIALIESIGLAWTQIATVAKGVAGIFSAIVKADLGALNTAFISTGHDFINNFKQTGTRMGEALSESWDTIIGKKTEELAVSSKATGEAMGEAAGQGFGVGFAKSINTKGDLSGLLVAEASIGSLLVKMEQAKPAFKSFQEAWAEVGRAGIDASDVINEGLAMTASGMGQAIGDLMSGVGGMQNVGAALLASIAGIMHQLGELAIGTGIAIGGIKKALMSLNPAVAIAGGVALIALAKVVSNKAKSMGGSMGGGGGGSIPSVSSPTRTSDVRNVNQTPVNITGNFRMQGKDLVAVIEKTDYTNSRVRG